MDMHGLLDERNIYLWNNLCINFDIDIKKEKRIEYFADSKDKKTTIYVPIGKIDAAFFTHELLHIFLRSKNVFIGGGLSLSIKESKVLSKIFSDNLIDHIGNCLDHIKMFPEFIRLGYEADKFIADYSDSKLTEVEIFKIKKGFITKGLFEKRYNSQIIDLYIGKYFAVIACPNKSIDYSKQFSDLKIIDSELFQILETFTTAWKTFDYNDIDPLTGGYHLFLFEFIDKLENWTDGKTIK